MSGHSKWNNIKRKKEKTDAAKAKIFTKIGREISVIVKTGGANPNENSKLKDAIAKAKAANVPNENIERIIKKAELAVDGEPVNLRVNHPFAAGLAEDLYLVSYDTSTPQPRYCIVQVVRQPAKYLMVAGIALLMLGVGWRLLLRL